MNERWTWTFVDGDVAGDGELWLAHHEQLTGWIDAVDHKDKKVRRIMVATESFVRRSIAELGAESKWVAIAAMVVVPSGTPTEIRAAVDAAVSNGALLFLGAEI